MISRHVLESEDILLDLGPSREGLESRVLRGDDRLGHFPGSRGGNLHSLRPIRESIAPDQNTHILPK